MINAIVMGLFNIILGLVSVVLAPIDMIISQFLPDLSSAISAVGNMFHFALVPIGFVVDCTGLSSETISLIIMYFTFKLTAPLAVSVVKQAIKWYKALKL